MKILRILSFTHYYSQYSQRHLNNSKAKPKYPRFRLPYNLNLSLSLLPEEITIPAIRECPGDIIQDQENKQKDENHKSDHHHGLLHFGAEIPSEQSLHAKDKDLSSIKNRNREKIDNPELKTDKGNEAQHRDEARAEKGI